MTVSNLFVTDSIKERLGINVAITPKMKDAINKW